MKILALNIFLMAFCQVSFSQNWQLLGEDEIGDCSDISIPDFSAAYYAIDIQEDSLWLMFVYDISNSDTHGDFGLILGVDTNLVHDDGGLDWDGPNQSMLPDVGYAFIRNGVFQTQIANSPNNPLNAVIYESATYDTVSLRFPLSAFDVDGRFNILAGSIRWGVGPNGYCEEFPNAGFLSVDSMSPAIESNNLMQKIKVYPNPASSQIWVEADGVEIEKLLLFDLMGKKVGESNSSSIPLSGLNNGIYVIRIKCSKCLYPIFEKITILSND